MLGIIFIFNEYPHSYINDVSMLMQMIIFIAGVFSGHILIKTKIPSELYCCNMISSVCW